MAEGVVYLPPLTMCPFDPGGAAQAMALTPRPAPARRFGRATLIASDCPAYVRRPLRARVHGEGVYTGGADETAGEETARRGSPEMSA